MNNSETVYDPKKFGQERQLPTNEKAGKTNRESINEAVAALDRLEPSSPKAKRIIAMWRTCLTDESGSDEETWPTLKRSLDRERTRIGARKLFDV